MRHDRSLLPLVTCGDVLGAEFASRLLERALRPEPACLLEYRLSAESADGPAFLVTASEESVDGRLYRDLTAGDYRRLDAYFGLDEGLCERHTGRARPWPESGSTDVVWVAIYVPTDKALRQVRQAARRRARRHDAQR